MYLDDEGPIAGGRELWGFPKKLASPKIAVESDVLVGTLHYGSVLCASATMGYKHRPVDHDAVLKGMKAPNFMLKIIPHVDGSPRICELVRYYLEDITLKEAWTGPAALGLFPHALADVARLPVREVVSALHCKADLTLGLGDGSVRLHGEVTFSQIALTIIWGYPHIAVREDQTARAEALHFYRLKFERPEALPRQGEEPFRLCFECSAGGR